MSNTTTPTPQPLTADEIRARVNPSDAYPLKEVGQWLGVHRNTVDKWAKEGRLKTRNMRPAWSKIALMYVEGQSILDLIDGKADEPKGDQP